MRLHFAALAALLAFQPAVAADSTAPSLLDFELRSLAEPEMHSLERYQGKPVLLVFFQPDCNWCLKQFRVVNELGSQCDNFEAIAVGIHGNRKDLREELRRLRPRFPAYQASPHLLDALGDLATTPLVLLGDQDGSFINWYRGYAAKAELKTFMAEAGNLGCDN